MSDTMDHDSDRVINEPMSEALSKRYLAYALSTITARALPDVRDGLKPVQRRILYAMRELKLNPEGAYRKCAKIVGEVMGNYHPHGDSAIYDTLVRLAQDFSVRYPLVDGQGNFGNIDGDAAAAMRYTESRMTEAAKLLLEGLDEDAVDFRDTYDESNEEPVVLPAGYPNLLANGATGIAVGMATSIPPHNAAEVIDAALLLIKDKNTPLSELLNVMPGPDFPTGGIIVEPRASIREAYETGRGSFRMRAKWHKEDLGRGTWQIVVTEIPYQVQKGRLIEKLAELIETKKLPLLEDVRDESAEDIRLILEPRSKTVDPDVLMESLFKASDLESRFSLNMNVLNDGVPQVMGLRGILRAYLDHRREVVQRRARHRLDKIEKRLHVLDGYLIAYLNIDEVIRIIREEDEPKQVMMDRFNITDVQAEAILNLRLRALRKLEEMELRGEHERLSQERDDIKLLLGSEARQWTRVGKELKEARKVFDPESELGRRRAVFDDAPDIDLDAALEASTPKEPFTVLLSKKGWIRAMKGHGHDVSQAKFKEGDELFSSVEVWSTDKVILMSSDGRAFTLAADKLPGGRGHGEPIRLSIDLEDHVDIHAMFALDDGRKRLVASSAGYGFIVPEAELVSSRKAGKSVVTVPDGAELCVCQIASGDQIAVIGSNKKMLVFEREELPEMPRGKGVKLQSYRGTDTLEDATVFHGEDGLFVVEPSGRNRGIAEWTDYVGKRAQAGKVAPKGFPRSGRFNS
ncbi:MAG: DNA topoisomerase IV subunit A [Pseudomonadota bacterium]